MMKIWKTVERKRGQAGGCGGLPEAAGGGIVFEAGGGEALLQFAGFHTGGGAEIFERTVFVAQLHVDETEQYEGVGG